MQLHFNKSPASALPQRRCNGAVSRNLVVQPCAVARRPSAKLSRALPNGQSAGSRFVVSTAANTMAPLARADHEIGKVLYSEEYLNDVLTKLGR